MPNAFASASLAAVLALNLALAAGPAAAQSKQPEAGAAKQVPPLPTRPQIPPAKKKGESPALRAECAWTGQRIVSLLWRDDVNTAREQSRFYEMFGCPAEHLPAAFRCVIEQSESQPDQADLNARVYGCWMDPDARGTEE